MNKYLLMCAAAAMTATAGTGVAQASTTVHFKSSGGGSYCDYLVVNRSGGGLYAGVHHGAQTCATTSLQNDPGIKGKKSIIFADGTLRAEGLSFDSLLLVLDLPLGKGAWELLANTNGMTTFVLNSGKQAPAKAKPGASKSTLSDALKAIRAK